MSEASLLRYCRLTSLNCFLEDRLFTIIIEPRSQPFEGVAKSSPEPVKISLEVGLVSATGVWVEGNDLIRHDIFDPTSLLQPQSQHPQTMNRHAGSSRDEEDVAVPKVSRRMWKVQGKARTSFSILNIPQPHLNGS